MLDRGVRGLLTRHRSARVRASYALSSSSHDIASTKLSVELLMMAPQQLVVVAAAELLLMMTLQLLVAVEQQLVTLVARCFNCNCSIGTSTMRWNWRDSTQRPSN